MEKERVVWKPILASAFVSAVVTIATGILLFQIQEEDGSLSYGLQSSVFNGASERAIIHQLRVRNAGKRLVKDVSIALDVTPATIRDKSIVSTPSLPLTASQTSSTLMIRVPNLNENEVVSVSVMATAKDVLRTGPLVSVRGEGVTAVKEVTDGTTYDVISSVIAALVGLAATYLLAYYFWRRRRRQIQLSDDGRHAASQHLVLSYLCSLHGLSEMSSSYLSRTGETKYWSEADHITSIAIASTDLGYRDRCRRVLNDLLVYARMTDGSEGIIHYNLARLAKVERDDHSVDVHLDAARTTIPKLVATRLGIDPLFGRDRGSGAPKSGISPSRASHHLGD